MADTEHNGREGCAAKKSHANSGTLVLELDGRILFEIEAAALDDHPVTIGRDKTCDWCTAGVDGTISSRHAELFRKRGSVWIRDLGSRNGMQIGGERVKERRMRFGDAVKLGACRVVFERPHRVNEANGSAYHRLEQTNGPEAGRIFELIGGADIVIGSDPGNPIFIPDTLVSRHHAKLSFKKDGSCWVSDMGSRNGTSVNGVPMAKEKERLLRDGDVVSVAYVEFKFLDKNAVHVNARIGAKLLVAAATVAVAVFGYSLWNMGRRDAGWFQARALVAASRWTPNSSVQDFDEAFSLLDQADVARNADAYRSNIKKTRMEMAGWTNTITGWVAVRSCLRDGKWVWAQEHFNTLSSWTWNADNATDARQEAEAVQTLVNIFLSSRIDIRRTNWESGSERDAFAEDARLLGEALAATDGDGRQYLEPLRGEAAELRSEFEATIQRLDAIRNVLAVLDPPNGETPANDAARSALRSLARMKDEDAAHAAERKAEIESEDFPYRKNAQYPFHAPIVETRIGEVMMPLGELADAEENFERNVANIAAGRWNALQNPLHLPSRELTDRQPEFMRHSRWLEERNTKLCGTPGRADGIRGSLQTSFSNLEKVGFGSCLTREPKMFAMLRDGSAIDAALSFVDAAVPLPQPESAEPVCAYDRLVGVFELGDFVSELAVDAAAVEASATYEAAWRGRAWKSELQQLRESLVALRRFRRWRDVDKTGLVRLVAEARVVSGENICAAAFAAADRLVGEVAAWRDGDLNRACAAAGTERAAILGEAIALLLVSDNELRQEPWQKRSEDLANRWRRLQGELKAINRRAETDPDGAWREIVAKGLPANIAPFKGAWRHLRTQGGEGK